MFLDERKHGLWRGAQRVDKMRSRAIAKLCADILWRQPQTRVDQPGIPARTAIADMLRFQYMAIDSLFGGMQGGR